MRFIRRHQRLDALQVLALDLASTGRVEESLATVDRATEVASGWPGPFGTGARADVLQLRAHVLHDAGRLEDCVESARAAIAVRRSLGRLDRDQTARLSDSLEILSNALTDLRRTEEADALSAEVLRLRAKSPWADRARGLMNRSATLMQAGRHNEGLAAARELVRGAVARPGNGGLADPTLAQGLSNLATLLRLNGEWREALRVQEVAVEQLRLLARVGGVRQQADLASALANNASMLMEWGRPEAALEPGSEALAIREELASAATAYEPALSDSLNNQACFLHRLGRADEAERYARRCVDVRRRLHADQPGAYELRLANALSTHGLILARLGRGEDAATAAEESVQRLRSLADHEPARSSPWLAGGLDTLAAVRAETGRSVDAFITTREAITVGRGCFADNPEGFGNLWVELLLEGAERLAGSHRDEALGWAQEAVTVLAGLSEAQPEAHAAASVRAASVTAALENA